MAPEPDSKPVTIRLALARVEAGEDLGLVLSELYDAAVAASRRIERRLRDPFAQEEPTPTVSARERLRPSARPTAPPPPRAPVGVYRGTSDLDTRPTGRTSRSFPSPLPPPPKKR